MIQSSSLSRPHLYDQSFTPAKKLMLTAIPAIHSNLNRTSLFPTSKYGKITGKLVHSNHFFKVQRKRFQLDQPSPMGGIEPDLNGFSESTIVIAPLEPFELDLFRLCSAVTLRFLTSFTNHLSTQSLITRFLISHLNFFIISSGRGRVRVELLAHYRKLSKNEAAADIVFFQCRRC